MMNELYGTTCEREERMSNKRRKVMLCKHCINRNKMKWLLDTATTDIHLHFDRKIFIQYNGVAMGSPLEPLLTDIFLVHLEKELIS
jgi:hypothetical protein